MNKNKTLLQKFIDFNIEKRLAGGKKKCLLAVSGGVDSVVMCDLFHKAGFPFVIAHCNFNLRGEESNADARFVKNVANKYRVKVFVNSFETAKYAEENKISIQLAARQLRYQWFEELRAEKALQAIATAHHLNDNIETIIYNLTRGTGIRGLRGIPIRQGRIIRPMLFASRTEIENYLKENKLAFREDASNATDDYTRNKIRHNIIPVMKEINPSLEEAIGEKIEIFTELEQMYEKKTKQLSKQLFLPRRNDIYIPIGKLKNTPRAVNVLFEYLKQFEFTIEQIEDMLSVIDDTSGKQFITGKARVIKDRQFFIVTQLPEQDFTTKLINEKEKEIELGDNKLKLSTVRSKTAKITPAKNIAWLDKSKLTFPLFIRKWKQGDYFYPFGMKMKKKKVKKFFIDEKVPLNEKENIWIIESAQKIVWVVGHRIDERFKVTPDTKDVLKVQWK